MLKYTSLKLKKENVVAPAKKAAHKPFYLNESLWLFILVVAIGALIRHYNLQLLPAFTDEMEEIDWSIRIAQGAILPLISIDTYNGPLFHYLMAFGLQLGWGSEWPRQFSFLLGSLTVGLTYLLGMSLSLWQYPARPLRSRLAGLIAALLMAVSFSPVVINSHLAWSNATTPFWSTLTVLALSETVRRNRPAGLIICAALGGLTLQTHPTAITMILAGAGWLAVTRPGWLGTRWPYLAALAGLLSISNLLAYNLLSGGGSVNGAARRDYAWTSGAGPADFFMNLFGFLGMACHTVSSSFMRIVGAADFVFFDYVNPAAWLYVVITIAALVYSRRACWLPLAGWISALLIVPYFNRAYASLESSRYIAWLLPLTFAAIALWLTSGLLARPALKFKLGPGLNILAGLATVILVVHPLTRIQEYYSAEVGRGQDNQRIWQVANHIKDTSVAANSPVWLDADLRKMYLHYGGNVGAGIAGVLELERIKYSDLNASPAGLEKLPPGALLVLTDRKYRDYDARFVLQPVRLNQPAVKALRGDFWFYRYGGLKLSSDQDLQSSRHASELY